MSQTLIDILEQGYRKKSWHGPNLKATIRRLTAVQAAWRPHADRKCIWEIVLHAAYWKYVVRRRITGEKRGSFPLKGSNWFALPKPATEAQWREAVNLLDREHEALVAVVRELTAKALSRKPPGSQLAHAFVISGAAFHDIYHAGQIQTLKGLQKSSPARRGGK